MSAQGIETKRLRYDSKDDLESHLEPDLKRIYSRGIYVDHVYEAKDESLVVHLGNVVPKDVSDSRDDDRVLKFIDIDAIYDLTAEPTNVGYIVELPARNAVYDGYIDRRNEILHRLDVSLAKDIYKQLVKLPAIQLQLNPIKEILQFTRQHSPEISINDVQEIQNSPNTDEYIEVLTEVGFITVDDEGMLYPGEKLDSYDLREISRSEFGQLILGDVVQEAYHTMRDELQLTMLGHYPKFSTAYYFAAIQRDDPELWLDVSAVQRNLSDWYDKEIHEFVVQSKLEDLAEVEVLTQDGELFSGNKAIYHDVRERVPA